MSGRRFLAETFKPAVDLLFPPRCPLCGDAIADQNGLCLPCWGKLEIPSGPCCTLCQRPIFTDPLEEKLGEGAICALCMTTPPKHDGIVAATYYNDASRQLVLAFKHGRKIALSAMLARQIAARLPQLEDPWLIIPVPLHRIRLWSRGYNQSALMANRIGKASKQQVVIDGLRRTKRTPPLGGLGRKAREDALANAIHLNPARLSGIKGANIILVDDVLTSGATSDACVKVLKKAGAAKVIIACYARVLGDAETPRNQAKN